VPQIVRPKRKEKENGTRPCPAPSTSRRRTGEGNLSSTSSLTTRGEKKEGGKRYQRHGTRDRYLEKKGKKNLISICKRKRKNAGTIPAVITSSGTIVGTPKEEKAFSQVAVSPGKATKGKNGKEREKESTFHSLMKRGG